MKDLLEDNFFTKKGVSLELAAVLRIDINQKIGAKLEELEKLKETVKRQNDNTKLHHLKLCEMAFDATREVFQDKFDDAIACLHFYANKDNWIDTGIGGTGDKARLDCDGNGWENARISLDSIYDGFIEEDKEEISEDGDNAPASAESAGDSDSSA